MAKGEDVLRRKKNKENRKKLNRETSNVSARVASIIASKKRRQSGKRRMCQGMCFSLPSLDDPFNERNGKMEFQLKDKKKVVSARGNKKVVIKGKGGSNKEIFSKITGEKNSRDQINEKLMNSRSEMKKSISTNDNSRHKNTMAQLKERDCTSHENSDYPSKFFILCLNAIEKVLRHEGAYNVDNSLFVNPWGVEFLKCCSAGKDILETSGSSCTTEQIAWIVSFAADTIARKEKEGLLVNSPFLLFLVPSQEKAVKVRLLCKPLKDLGIHAVSLHPGASLDHQIHGLKSCEPEFLVSTPERLMELVSLKAIDISSVSFLVVDGLDCLAKEGCLSTLKCIRKSILGNPNTVVFNNFYTYDCVKAMQDVLSGSVSRLSSSDSIGSQSACVIQTVNVCSSQEEKHSKGIQVLSGAYDNQPCSGGCLKVLYIVENDSKSVNLVKSLKLNGYRTSTGCSQDISDVDNSLDLGCREKPVVCVIKAENISSTDLGIYETVILLDFTISIDNYVQILTRMARHTIHGVLYSFLTEEDAAVAGSVIKILEECGQAVPEALRCLHSK
ncbi:pre-mRNA-processing ATP-dependent RNA helicase prp5 [Euphorbia lathyris]|uniref:pre-mRNA-processing ATP-dependent RNA helicase prp5 n=1 Tax=Euphorbia lathyris TaxID=212925 RepID=UPI0033135F06